MFDEDGNGEISKSEFVSFVQFSLAVLHCESMRKAGEAAVQEELEDGDAVIEEMLSALAKGKGAMFEVMAKLPPDFAEYLDAPEFRMQCHEKFDALDADLSGALSVDELYPVVAELAQTREWVVSDEQCARVSAMFDEDGNGEISKSEFVSFVRFSLAVLHCESMRKADEAAVQEELEDGDAVVEEMLSALAKGKGAMFEVMAKLPPDFAEYLDAPEFRMTVSREV